VTLDATHVAGDLWIGSHPGVQDHSCEGPHDDTLEVARRFDCLVLTAVEWQPPTEFFPGVEVYHAPFDDDYDGVGPGQLELAFQAAAWSAGRLRAGKSCLITCWAGLNRSGLTTALTLAEVSGMDPQTCGRLISAKREYALSNPFFRQVLARLSTKEPCELCDARELTRRYHEDRVCWVADCKTCGVPMVVYKVHGEKPSGSSRRHMLKTLLACAPPRRGGWELDLVRRSIPDHFHAHLRPRT
jgi:hypothetical protein